MHLISKMRPAADGGGRIGIVLNGSPLFTGDAGSGESEIRRWIIENDMLDAIIALPNDLFYNTGIATFVWILDNNKKGKRNGKVQLIDATRMYAKMKKSLGNIFDDDGAGEAADVVAIRVTEANGKKRIDVEFYHCKYAGGAPGARVDDLYVVCGQAQRSICWLANKDRRTDLFAHLLKREGQRLAKGKATRFDLGDRQKLGELHELSRRCEVSLSVFIVQPGLSQAAASRSQLLLLAVAERYLTETYQVPFAVICSK
jgi:hypothetical protein